MDEFFAVNVFVALFTLTALEIVLGIDNIVFIAIITGRLPEQVQPRARNTGLLAAMGMRIVLLFGVTWIMRLTTPLFTLFAESEHPLGISGKDLILLGGGLFLVAKATFEIHHKLEADDDDHEAKSAAASFGAAIMQIMAIDAIFSLDSVITAVGMTEGLASTPVRLTVMITAVVIAVLVMMAFAGPVARFVEKHPTMKMLALAFLILIGVMLVAEGLHQHINRGYIYFSMAFALGVELLNMRVRANRTKLRLKAPRMPAGHVAGVIGP